MDGEICARIRPRGDRLPSGPACQCREGIQCVLVAVLGVDGLAGAEFEHPACQPYLLPLLAGEMHLDAATVGIVEGMMAETCKIEVAVELAVDAREEVEIEPGRDAGFVVVGGVEDAAVLYQVDPDDQGCAASQHTSGMAQERAGFVRLEISDGRSWEETDKRHGGDRGRQ